MAVSDMVNLSGLLDEAKCFELVRQHRWPNGVRCPDCDSAVVIRNGHDDGQRHRQRSLCEACHGRFDDLTGTVETQVVLDRHAERMLDVEADPPHHLEQGVMGAEPGPPARQIARIALEHVHRPAARPQQVRGKQAAERTADDERAPFRHAGSYRLAGRRV